jgi:aspartyl/glutamyl-tRNA(Asn/Gln) amidotransferase C subunit
MSLNSQDIARIAHLARLELHPQESERMLSQINGFFDLVEKMRAVDTSGVEPLTHPVAAIRDVACACARTSRASRTRASRTSKARLPWSAACSWCRR